MLSGSILYSARVIWYSASGPTPQMKSSWMSFAFPDHPDSMTTSSFNSGVMSILCSLFVNCLNRSNHYLGANTAFPSKAFASRFGTMFFSAIKIFVQFKNWLTAPFCILGLRYKKSIKRKICILSTVLYRNKSL